MPNMLARRAAAVALSAGLLAGGSVALAAPASAVGSSGCTSSKVYKNGYYLNSNHALTQANPLKFRSGPGTSYAAKGLLSPWTKIHLTCSAKNYNWSYGKVESGAHKGEWGWVYSWETSLGK
ncbi:hypothetical protein [Streptomyces lydicus]|uniref:hypothetical protein n=1 Tax=Streptomyces lydicus TaxID=47763 RepID=UPI001010EC42|nr:hypothetical protein [Streptomyces lydicus]MCZ1011938.1 hypothetical protein [Streptomyces lydicus]